MKIDISKLREHIVETSKTGSLCWKPTNHRVRIDKKVYLGYKAKLPSGLSIKTLPHLIGDEMVSSLIIEGETKELFLTENSRKLSGIEVTDPTDLLTIITSVNETLENKNLINSIDNELAKFLYFK